MGGTDAVTIIEDSVSFQLPPEGQVALLAVTQRHYAVIRMKIDAFMEDETLLDFAIGQVRKELERQTYDVRELV